MSDHRALKPTNSRSFTYDAQYDILYLYYGDPAPSYEDEDFPGVYIRRADADDHVTGAIIYDYLQRDPEQLQRMIPFPVDFDAIFQTIHSESSN